MRFKLIHPLWTHLPAILVFLVTIVFTVMALPLPDSAPVHFDINGQPNGYGSPWISTAILLVLSLFFIILSVVLDELWARQETRKSFNWISLFDEITVSDLCAVQIAYINMLASSTYIFPFPWTTVLPVTAIITALAVALELRRPYRHYEQKLLIEDTCQINDELLKLKQSGQPLVYWESQNPAYAGMLAVIMPALLFIVAIVTWSEMAWLSILMILIGLGLTLTYGGFRTLVTRDSVTVKMGILGIKLLRLKISQITSAEVHAFAPIKDFGGYGIRFNSEMQAYFLNGNRGVKVATAEGKKYLIGSDHPERLAAVISAIVL
ncbi:MAG: DUF1648 domain-containing protein [Dehalococcoidia bacterium]|nr:DUF1648 domain-containing protein [Dehalococcoidia bacterium]MDD5494090.1 DUF1648 domain-containing protein [Dehalococcoidia bacterium]